jgi:hypothetical protein
MRNIFELLMAITSFFCLSIQNTPHNCIVEGNVKDENLLPVEGVNILLLSQEDSSFIKTVSSDKNGKFLMNGIQPGRYILQVTMIGYKKEKRDISLTDGQILSLKTFDLKVEDYSLGNIVVIAQKPAIKIAADRSVVDLSHFTLNTGGNAYTVMQSLPGVFIDSKGLVSLNGRGQTKIMIDGKDLYLTGEELVNYLKSMQISSIDKIELITNPSAKYDAGGSSGIINIRTQNLVHKASEIILNSNYEQGKYGRANNSISFNREIGRFRFYGMCGYYMGKDFIKLKINRDYDYLMSNHIILNQNSYRLKNDHSMYYNGSINYDKSADTSIEWYITGNSSKRNIRGNMGSDFSTYNTVDSALTSSTNNINRTNNLRTGINLRCRLDSIGKELELSTGYLYYSVKEDQLHNDSFYIFSDAVRSMSCSKDLKDGNIKVFTAQSDLNCPVSKKLLFEGGVKTTFARVDNTSAYCDRKDDKWVSDTGLSSFFQYDENINSIYLNSKISINKLNVEAGLRFENTNTKECQHGLSTSQKLKHKKSYIDIFPNISVGYNISSNHLINFIFNRRIDRPDYQDMNPFVYIFDAYTYEEGNTALKPQFSNNFDMSYIYRNNYLIDFYYNHIDNAIVKSYRVTKGSKRTYIMPDNMSGNNSFGMRMQVGHINISKMLNTSMSLIFVRKDYKWRDDNVTLTNKGTSFMFNIYNRINITNGLSAELSGFYNSEMPVGQITLLPMWRLSATIRQSLFHEKASLSLYSNDLFYSYQQRIKGVIGGTFVRTKERDNDHCIIGLSFVLRFNNGKLKKSSHNKDIFDTKRITL